MTAAAVVDDYLESPMEGEDVFPCKGCGEILEEGKAFELAGNRWHLNCFRCNTCGTLLDSDANLLLLGDGSLICNNCTYSCSACGNKIEDLAILTGDQAFCATCFRCRNCKRKIENLRYARTSQGIFCMSCHESLMARRRKKSKAAAQAKAREKESSPMLVDKSLPALPPNAVPPAAFSTDHSAADSDTPTELSPRPRPTYPRANSSRSSSRPPRSPERSEANPRDSGLTLPASSYRGNRNSGMFTSPPPETAGGGDPGDTFFIPVALDPSPALTMSPRSTSETLADSNKRQDYFSASKGSPASDRKSESQASTPHIAFQEKNHKAPSEYEKPPERASRRLSKSARPDKNVQAKASPPAAEEKEFKQEFKLQDAPKSKKLMSPRSGSQSSNAVDEGTPKGSHMSRKGSASTGAESERMASPRASQDTRSRDSEDTRPTIDSAVESKPEIAPKAIARKQLPSSAAVRTANGKPASGAKPAATASEDLVPPPRPGVDHKMSDTYMQPRAPPQPPAPPAPPAPAHVAGKESTSTTSDVTSPKLSPKLPRWSATGDFSMDEDMARILGTDEGSSSILRRVSNAVRHGRTASTESSNHPATRKGHSRSVSETTRGTSSPRWPKTPTVNGHSADISSPIAAGHDDPAFLKRQLRNSEQRVAELERQFHSEKDLRDLNEKLDEKRKTVSVLDTQTEIMIRQLEVLAGYVERAKETKRPIDPRDLEDSAIKEFVQKLDKVKQSMSATIEQLHAERDELVDEKNKAIADRDRALLEFEQLSSKNAQLADMNNDLTHQIQERFKAQIGTDIKSPNGLGIYQKGVSSASVNLDSSSIQTGATLVSTDADEPILESGPTVVNIRKGQVRKFNWKKGSKTVAQNITKGMGRAVVAFQQGERERMHGGVGVGVGGGVGGGGGGAGLNSDNIGLPYNMMVTTAESPVTVTHIPPNGQNARAPAGAGAGADAGQQAASFRFFGKKGGAGPLPKSVSMANVAMPAVAEAPTTLFGSDLVERADFERRQIPSVVTRCIEEVELRGMDVEGIYRKTGGNSQVKMIQEGFDKTEDYDISDPVIDITAVTSVLKQYFRKLPTPLLTFDIYDRILESNSIADEEERCSHLKTTINMLPQKHRDCLEFLMFHLARVASRESENLMSPKNLAVVFAPTIMRDHSLEREMTDMHAKNNAVQFVIEHSNEIFSDV